MTYIDFDGVILDTEQILFEEWRKIPNRALLPETEKIKYIQNSNWNYIVNHSQIINDSIYHLKNMDPEKSLILTKIHSLENEGCAKVKWLRKNLVKQSIILVPYNLKKFEMAIARGNILVDDCLKNLREWESCGGIPFFFDMDDDNYDSWQQPNTDNYQKVLDLSRFK